MAPQFESAPVATVYRVLQGGATHLEALGDGGRMRGWDLAECMVNQCTSNAGKDVALFSCSGTTANGPCGAYADGIRFTSAMSAHVAGCMAPDKCLQLCIP